MTRRIRAKRSNHLGLMALEPRWMFDGAAAHDAVDAKAVPAPVEVKAAYPSRNGGRKEVVFVDTSVADYKTLEAAVKDGVAIVEIDGTKDGLAQMAKWAETHTGYDSIAILDHGADGVQKIGATSLSSTTLQDAQTKEWLAELGASLTADGDILLYGCDVAKSETGKQFVTDLAAATGADVLASDDITGRDGNWTLEYSRGSIHSTDVLSVTGYDFNLQANSVTFSATPMYFTGLGVGNSLGVAFNSTTISGDADQSWGSSQNNITFSYSARYDLSGGGSVNLNGSYSYTYTGAGSNQTFSGGGGALLDSNGNTYNTTRPMK